MKTNEEPKHEEQLPQSNNSRAEESLRSPQNYDSKIGPDESVDN
jgi:hypothetical protein